MGEHVDRRELGEAVSAVEQLVQVALLGHRIAADVDDAARFERAGGLEELWRGAGTRRVDGKGVDPLAVLGCIGDVVGRVVCHEPGVAGESVELRVAPGASGASTAQAGTAMIRCVLRAKKPQRTAPSFPGAKGVATLWRKARGLGYLPGSPSVTPVPRMGSTAM